METNSKNLISLVPWILPLHIIAAYSFVAANYRGLFWAWEIRYLPFLILMGVSILHSLVSMIFLYRLSWIGIWIYQLGLGIVMVYNTHLAMGQKRHSLLILIFCMFAVSVFLLEKAKLVLRLPYYFSRRKWWESVPKGIPGIRGEIIDSSQTTCLPVRVTNLGKEGCFIFNENGPVSFQPQRIKIYHDDKMIFDCRVFSKVTTDDGFGCGLQFDSEEGNLDWYKELKDYLNSFRRSGYEYNS